MKKLIGIAAAGAMLVALAGCAGGGGAASEGPKALDELVVGFAQVGAESRAGAPPTPSTSRRRSRRRASSSSSPTRSRSRRTRSRRSAPTSSRASTYIAFSPGRRDRLGRGAQGGQGRRHPGGPHRPRRRQRGHSLYVSFLGSDFIEEGKKAGDWVLDEYADGTETVNIVAARGHDRLRAGDRPRRGLRRRHPPEPEPRGRREPDRRLHPRRRQAGHGGAAEVQPGHRPRVRAQRRHGPRRDRGDRGGRPGARRGHQDRHGRRRQGRHAGARRRQDQLHRGVLAAARPAADGHRQEAQRRRHGARSASSPRRRRSTRSRRSRRCPTASTEFRASGCRGIRSLDGSAGARTSMPHTRRARLSTHGIAPSRCRHNLDGETRDPGIRRRAGRRDDAASRSPSPA